MKKINKIISISMIGAMLISTMPVNALVKDETVYTKLNNDGSIKNTTVVEHVTDSNNINDVTDLKDILNINGNEDYSLNNNDISFNANDIFYQGTSDKELPVSLDVTYLLDGKETSLDDLLGKSGSVSIKINYINNEKHSVKINGSYTTLYTPFVVTTGAVMDATTNKNINVTNGKVVTNGTSNIVVGIASPGLSKSLGMDLNMDSITISLDTESFELPTIYTVITSNIISDADLTIFNKLDTMYSSINTLSDTSKLLVNGSANLTDGITELNSKYKQFDAGMNELSKGSDQLTQGYQGISSGIDALYEGVQKVSTLISSVDQLSSGISQLSYLTNQIAENSDTINSTVNETILGLQNHIQNLTNIAMATTDESTKALLIEEIKGLQSQLDIESLTGLQTNINTLNSSLNTLNEKMTLLNESTKNLGTSLSSLINGISQLYEGNKLFTENLNKLNSSILYLTNIADAVGEGIDKTQNGSNTLSEGIAKFDNEGIEKIVGLVNNNVNSFEQRVKSLTNLASDYDTYTLKNKDTESKTKFVLMIDGEKKEETKENKTEVKTEKLSLWQRFLNLFK